MPLAKILKLSVCLLVVGLLAGALRSAIPEQAEHSARGREHLAAPTPAPRQQGLRVRDGRGHELQLARVPQRVASASLVSDQILVELMQAAGELQRLVAVSYFADDTQYSDLQPLVAAIPGRVGLNVEALLALQPDLVILASFNRPELIAQIEAAGIAVFVMQHFTSFAAIAEHVRSLGSLVGLAELANTKATKLLAQVAVQKERCRQARAGRAPTRFLRWDAHGGSEGRATMFDALVEAVGGENVVASLGLSGWPQLSPEALLQVDADWVVMLGEAAEGAALRQQVQASPSLAHTAAARRGQVLLLSPRRYNDFSSRMLENLAPLAEVACRP